MKNRLPCLEARIYLPKKSAPQWQRPLIATGILGVAYVALGAVHGAHAHGSVNTYELTDTLVRTIPLWKAAYAQGIVFGFYGLLTSANCTKTLNNKSDEHCAALLKRVGSSICGGVLGGVIGYELCMIETRIGYEALKNYFSMIR